MAGNFLRYELFSSLNFGPLTHIGRRYNESTNTTDGRTESDDMSPACISTGVLKNVSHCVIIDREAGEIICLVASDRPSVCQRSHGC